MVVRQQFSVGFVQLLDVQDDLGGADFFKHFLCDSSLDFFRRDNL
jgi:hypothetical protein